MHYDIVHMNSFVGILYDCESDPSVPKPNCMQNDKIDPRMGKTDPN